jgi:hypothetical protein
MVVDNIRQADDSRLDSFHDRSVRFAADFVCDSLPLVGEYLHLHSKIAGAAFGSGTWNLAAEPDSQMKWPADFVESPPG